MRHRNETKPYPFDVCRQCHWFSSDCSLHNARIEERIDLVCQLNEADIVEMTPLYVRQTAKHRPPHLLISFQTSNQNINLTQTQLSHNNALYRLIYTKTWAAGSRCRDEGKHAFQAAIWNENTDLLFSVSKSHPSRNLFSKVRYHRFRHTACPLTSENIVLYIDSLSSINMDTKAWFRSSICEFSSSRRGSQGHLNHNTQRTLSNMSPWPSRSSQA